MAASSSSSSSSSSTADVLAHHHALLARVALGRKRRSPVVLLSERSIPVPAEGSAGSSARRRRAAASPELVDLTHVPEAKRAKAEALYPCYRFDEETVRNDLPARYAVTGDWGGNFIAGAEEHRRFDEYPRSQKLLRLKKELLARHSHRPLFLPLAPLRTSPTPSPAAPPAAAAPGALSSSLPASHLPPLPSFKTPHSDVPPSLRPFNAHLLSTLGQTRFDSVVVTPPASMAWDEIAALPIRQLTAEPAFVYLWVGEGGEGGLERGREALARWGFRRCEEIVWVRTNKAAARGPGRDAPTESVFQNSKEHCLMGIRGTVRRAVDGWLVHCNIDTDVIVWEGDKDDPHAKPPELFSLAENFSMGTRRLDLFGSRARPRKGWVTAGWDTSVNGDGEARSRPGSAALDGASAVARLEEMVVEEGSKDDGLFDRDAFGALALVQGRFVLPTPPDIESLRPKSPVRNGSGPSRPHSSQNNGGSHFGRGNAHLGGGGNRPYTPSAAGSSTSTPTGFASLPPTPTGYASLPPTPFAPHTQHQQQQQQQAMPMAMPGMMSGGGGMQAMGGFGAPYGMQMGGFMPAHMGAYGMGMGQPNGMQFQMAAFGSGQPQQQQMMMPQLHLSYPYHTSTGQAPGPPSSAPHGNLYGGGGGVGRG